MWGDACWWCPPSELGAGAGGSQSMRAWPSVPPLLLGAFSAALSELSSDSLSSRNSTSLPVSCLISSPMAPAMAHASSWERESSFTISVATLMAVSAPRSKSNSTVFAGPAHQPAAGAHSTTIKQEHQVYHASASSHAASIALRKCLAGPQNPAVGEGQHASRPRWVLNTGGGHR